MAKKIFNKTRRILRKATDFFQKKKRLASLRGYINKRLFQSQDQSENEFPNAPGSQFDFNEVYFKSKEERFELIQQNPEVPPYMFLMEEQKEEFFEDRNLRFNKNLNQLPQKRSRSQKKVSFSQFFDVRPFDENELIKQIAATKSFSDSYQSYHYS